MSARLLLIEDDPVSSEVLAALLVSRGYAVDQAADGFSGLRMAQEQRYDLVLVDYHLPEMDGYAFARLMRSLGEKTDQPMPMIAITADRHGLAARRGVDGVFDRLLAKPIDPDELYACVEDVLCKAMAAAAAPGEIDEFLSGPTSDDAQSASHVLWRVRGLADLPRAAVFPAPSPSELTGLSYCFRITQPSEAECLLLLSEAGLPALARHRRSAPSYLQPLVTVGEVVPGDAAFLVGDAESWTRVADVLKDFQQRADLLRAEARSAVDPDMRVLAFLFVRGAAMMLRRDSLGRAEVVNGGGFASPDVIEAVKRLAAKGFVGSRPHDQGHGGKELAIFLTDKGQHVVADPRRLSQQGAARGSAVPG